jgi:hypothetical protein
MGANGNIHDLPNKVIHNPRKHEIIANIIIATMIIVAVVIFLTYLILGIPVSYN